MTDPGDNRYTLYQASTGLIVGSVVSSGAADASGAGSGRSQIAGAYDGSTYWVDITQNPPVAALKTALAITASKLAIQANDVDEAVFSNIPAQVNITINGSNDPQVVIDGQVDFSTSNPGTYTIVFSGAPYLAQSFQVVAT